MPAITFIRNKLISCGLLNPVMVKNFTRVTNHENKTSQAIKSKYSKSVCLSRNNSYSAGYCQHKVDKF
jgi:hypothetical protein